MLETYNSLGYLHWSYTKMWLTTVWKSCLWAEILNMLSASHYPSLGIIPPDSSSYLHVLIQPGSLVSGKFIPAKALTQELLYQKSTMCVFSPCNKCSVLWFTVTRKMLREVFSLILASKPYSGAKLKIWIEKTLCQLLPVTTAGNNPLALFLSEKEVKPGASSAAAVHHLGLPSHWQELLALCFRCFVTLWTDAHKLRQN